LTLHHVGAIDSCRTDLDENFIATRDRDRPAPGHQDIDTARLPDLHDSHGVSAAGGILDDTH
jgi:hypothetical protein